MKYFLLLAVTVCLCACATQGLHCSDELQPINVPAAGAAPPDDVLAPDVHR